MIRALSDPEFVRRVQSAAGRRRIFLSDFDGTLGRIVPDFLKARPGAGVADALRRMREAGWIVVILTGRGLLDLRSRIRVDGAIYGGNHGWEWTGDMRAASGQPSAAAKRKVRAGMRTAARVMKGHLSGIPGVQVERKLYFVAVHHRLVPASRSADFNRAFARARRDARLKGLRWRKGKKIWELLSGIPWGKGEGTELLVRRYRPELVVAAGDDATDEEMFGALDRRALTVRVGRSSGSRARYFVRRQEEMLRLMDLLAEARD